MLEKQLDWKFAGRTIWYPWAFHVRAAIWVQWMYTCFDVLCIANELFQAFLCNILDWEKLNSWYNSVITYITVIAVSGCSNECSTLLLDTLDYVTIHCFSFKFEHIGEFVLYLNMIKESNPIGVLLEGDLW